MALLFDFQTREAPVPSTRSRGEKVKVRKEKATNDLLSSQDFDLRGDARSSTPLSVRRDG